MTAEAAEMRDALHRGHIPHYLEELFESVLVAERHATVERLRLALLPPVIDDESPEWQRLVRDYLDAELRHAHSR